MTRGTLIAIGLAAIFCGGVGATLPEALPTRHDTVTGYAGVSFGMKAEDARDALGAEATLGEVCGAQRAVAATIEADGRPGHLMAMVDKDGGIGEIELTFADNSPVESAPACFADLERILQMRSRHYAGYALTRSERPSGTAMARRATLVFKDGSALRVRSKYWEAGGTCYTSVVFRPPQGD